MMSRSKQIGSFVAYARDRQYGDYEDLCVKLKVGVFSRLSNSSEPIVYRKNLKGHHGCVNAIEFSKDGGRFIASGGDDKRVLLWNTHQALSDMGKPVSMSTTHYSNIFCISFDNEHRKLISGGNDANVIIHDIESKKSVQTYLHEDVVYGISVDPENSNLVGTASDDGRILIIDTRGPQIDNHMVIATSQNPMQGLKHNPMDSRIIASANSGDGTSLWDIRKPKCPLKNYASKGLKHSDMIMNVAFDTTGRKLASLRKWSGPVVYDMFDHESCVELGHPNYLNSCTMKSCTFAGEKGEFIISGSDDFNLYMWRLPDDKYSEAHQALKVKNTHCILKGHRSIVNQVRYDPKCCLIISSGVEKIVKVWSPFPIGNGTESSRFEAGREEYTYAEFLPYPTVGRCPESPSAEDPSMLAFFDELIRRERVGDNSIPLEWYMSTFDDQNSTASSIDLSEDREASSINDDQYDVLDDTSTSPSSLSSDMDTSIDDCYHEDELEDVRSVWPSVVSVTSPAARDAISSNNHSHDNSNSTSRADSTTNRKRTPEITDEDYLKTHWKKKKMDELGNISSELANQSEIKNGSASSNGTRFASENEKQRFESLNENETTSELHPRILNNSNCLGNDDSDDDDSST